jgi:hypothetical protein
MPKKVDWFLHFPHPVQKRGKGGGQAVAHGRVMAQAKLTIPRSRFRLLIERIQL